MYEPGLRLTSLYVVAVVVAICANDCTRPEAVLDLVTGDADVVGGSGPTQVASFEPVVAAVRFDGAVGGVASVMDAETGFE